MGVAGEKNGKLQIHFRLFITAQFLSQFQRNFYRSIENEPEIYMATKNMHFEKS